MFDRASIQAIVDRRTSVPHRVSVLSPYAFEIRPAGFPGGTPYYSVHVERIAFRTRAEVVTDRLAVAIVAAVVAGVRNNPRTLEQLRAAVERVGWQLRTEVSAPSFEVAAACPDLTRIDDPEFVEDAVCVAVALSDFVLAQLIVTRTYGEMRPAVERPVGAAESADVWLYDPAERDRATQVHKSLENWLMTKLRELAIEPLDPAGDPFFDLAWRLPDALWVCEVKSSANHEEQQLRLGLGQVLRYSHLLADAPPRLPTRAALLIEHAPSDARWLALCTDLGVLLFWPDRWDEVQTLVSERRTD